MYHLKSTAPCDHPTFYLPYSCFRDYSFISIQIDGKTEADFYCSFEGLYYYAFHLAEILWGILWLYDLQVLTGKPGLYTGKYLMYYACVAYFTAFGFSIVLYFQNVDNFTSVSILFSFCVSSCFFSSGPCF